MTELVIEEFKARDFEIVDADASTGGKDFLERILDLGPGLITSS
jgi:hypothetical protein